MSRDIVVYRIQGDGVTFAMGDAGGRDRMKLFTLLDQLQDWYGHSLIERRIDSTSTRDLVTIVFDGNAWIDREDRADRLERMLKWLVLKLSVEELRYLGIVPRTADPAAFSVEQLIEGLREQFDRFAAADDRLRGTNRG